MPYSSQLIELIENLHATQPGMTTTLARSALQRPRIPKEPHVGTTAIVTSDGFVLANFTTAEGVHHHGAFIGAEQEIRQNLDGLAEYLDLPPPLKQEFDSAINAWLRTPSPTHTGSVL